MPYRPAACRLFQRTVLNQQCGNRAASFVQTRLDDDAFGGRIDRCGQFQYFGFEQYGFEQRVDVRSFFAETSMN